MKNLSLSQQYLLFTMNRQGKISSVNYYVGMCLVMAGLLDLQAAGVIELEQKEIIVLTDELPAELEYLNCLLNKIMQLKKKGIEKIANAYGATFFEKDLKQLVAQIRGSLIQLREIRVEGTTSYLAKENTIAKLVARLENLNALDNDGLTLAILLKKSSYLKKYIDKEDRKELEAKIKAAKNDPVSKQTQLMISQLDWLVGALVVVTA
ncbi:Golgi phosphoprotein 3 (GPP34) [Enterococcus malodoratus]|uniref:GPP34 family phosphoprotein n=1 Tax=Enterococcus malodoratus TaxID=71451 RepID=UPI0008CD15ED|nr:GPP34 family phosphoprotein [Enterococcus malodoratus]SET02872.1 Golgi phosphoprotein 3 (GPP34) [Enterococcus malodoratus]